MLGNSRGVSLVELMVATVVLTVGVVGAMGAFKYISGGLSQGRTETIAINLAQEKMEKLKNNSYYQLMVTTMPIVPDTNYVPNLVYGSVGYPPETISLWGQPAFTRGVEVDFAGVTGLGISTYPFTDGDTGMKKITVIVKWRTAGGSYKKVQLDNLYENPSVLTLTAGFKGTVNISGAKVAVVGYPQWRATSDSTGYYNFAVARGSYSLTCSSAGYKSQTTGKLNAPSGSMTVQNFTMVPIPVGTVVGDVWISSTIVISQVVASSGTQGGFAVQYVELFNPTTFTWSMDNSHFGLYYIQNNIIIPGCSAPPANGIDLTFRPNKATFPPKTYYLISSTSPVNAAGGSLVADAWFTSPSAGGLITPGDNGGIAITSQKAYSVTTMAIYDKVAWGKAGAASPPACLTEGTAITLAGGLQDNQQLVRMTSTAPVVNASLGNAYDTDNNYYNFVSSTPITIAPRNSVSTATAVSGRPAFGAVVVVNDGNSSSTQAVSLQTTTYAYAEFKVVNVATTTAPDFWQVTVASGAYSTVLSSVAVKPGQTTYLSSPTWTVAGSTAVFLTSATKGGYVMGYVYTSFDNSAPANNILMYAAGNTTRSDANGFYVMNVATGTSVRVDANYNLDNGNYMVASAAGPVTTGNISWIAPDPYFHLVQGAQILGWITSDGVTALPSVVVQAIDAGNNVGLDTSRQTGSFYISVSTSTSQYTLTPQLDPMSSYTSQASPGAPCAGSPIMCTVNVPGQIIFAGTITVSGALGGITGSVTSAGSVITTGVLIYASTSAVSDPPPIIYGSSAGIGNIYYAVSSQADGTFTLPVRGDTNSYYVRAWYPKVNINTGNIDSKVFKDCNGVVVTAGQTRSAANYSCLNYTW